MIILAAVCLVIAAVGCVYGAWRNYRTARILGDVVQEFRWCMADFKVATERQYERAALSYGQPVVHKPLSKEAGERIAAQLRGDSR